MAVVFWECILKWMMIFPHLLIPSAREHYARVGWALHLSVAYSTDAPWLAQAWRELSLKWDGVEYTLWPSVVKDNAVAIFECNCDLLWDLLPLHEAGSFHKRPFHISL